ncbi:Protein of unknown function [Propionibacterium freudenreichii]|uniref:O-antigen polymerase n=1 Tax=Propionibacterium freudenreichii TaxID=1744 RepID=UPI0005437F81|nr:O-antigen polymerase [Propionibacterium freudenreichii]CEH02879.1 Protein of unknown function [Propionibacterium freudenreichii]
MTMSVVTALMLLVSAAVCWTVSGNKFNAGSLTAWVWLVVLVVASIPGALNPSLLGQTKHIVFGAAVCCLGFAVGWILFSSKEENSPILISPLALRRTHIVLLALLCAGTALEVHGLYPVVQQLGGFTALWAGGGGGADFRLLALSERQAELAGGTNLVSGLMTYVTAPGLLAPVTGALMWKQRRFFLAVLPLVIVAIRAVVILERTSFMRSLLLFLLLLGLLTSTKVIFVGEELRPHQKPKRNLSRVLVIGTAAAAAAAALLLPLLARNSGTTRSTGWASLGQYILSSIGGLNFRIAEGTAFLPGRDPFTSQAGAYPGFGAYTFSGTFSVLRRLGLPVPYAPQTVDYSTIYIFNQPFSTNTWTMLRDLHMDFGPIGGYIAYFSLFLLAGLAGRAVISGRQRFLAVYAILGGTLVWSFLADGMLGSLRYLFAMVCSIWIFQGITPSDIDITAQSKESESTPITEVNEVA